MHIMVKIQIIGLFEACDLTKRIDIELDFGAVKIWGEHDGGSFEEDLKPFRDEGDACELFMFAFTKNCEVEIFTKPRPVT